MKTLAVFAIVVSLISVQGSSINKEVHEHDYGLDNGYRYPSVEGRDTIIAGKIENDHQDMDDHQTTGIASQQCHNNVCSVCQGLYCLSVLYLVENDNFVVQISKQFVPIFQENIEATDWEKCIELEMDQEQTCVGIEHVFIEDGHACIDLYIFSEFMTETFSDICM